MRRSVTLRDAALFFLPLIFMTELNMISKSVIHAFLARLAEPTITLAAFSIAFAFYYTVTSGTEVSTLISISYLRDKRAIPHLLGFFCVILSVPFLLVQLVAWTPLGTWIYGGWFGASAEVTRQAQWATFCFSFSAPILLFRALAFAQLMTHRRTIWITLSTLLRLLSLGVSLVLLPLLIGGAAIGAAALATCMAVEAAFAWWAGRGFFRGLPADAGERPSYWELWRFAWPLILAQMSEMGILMTINLFLGRLASPDLALASFGVVHGLVNLLLSPMRNLVHTGQTLTRTREDLWVMVRFATWLVVIFTALIAGVFLVPFVREWVLRDVMGLTPDLAAYSTPAVQVAFLIAVFWGYGALFRGLLAGARRTAMIALSGTARILSVVAVGSVTLVVAGLNGALFGILAWALTFAVESGILGARLFGRSGATLFDSEVPGPAPASGDGEAAAGAPDSARREAD